MQKKIIAISLMLVLVLSFASCTQEPTPQEITEGVIEAQGKIRTYQFELDMTMNTTGEVGGEAIEQMVTMNNNGTLDLENQQVKFNMLVDAADEGTGEIEAYAIDGMMYSKVGLIGEESMWTKGEMPVEMWKRLKAVSGYDSYQELLKTAEVEVTGSEK